MPIYIFIHKDIQRVSPGALPLYATNGYMQFVFSYEDAYALTATLEKLKWGGVDLNRFWSLALRILISGQTWTSSRR
jgi:hypothetical protein